jgi:DNA-binding MarR family transcriptional regulator
MNIEKNIEARVRNESTQRNEPKELKMNFSPEIKKMIEEGLQYELDSKDTNHQKFIENAIRLYHNTLTQGFVAPLKLRSKEDIKRLVDELCEMIITQDGTEISSLKKKSEFDFIDYIAQQWNFQGIELSDTTSIYLRISRISQHLSHLETTLRAEPFALNLNELQMLLAIKRSGTNGSISPAALKESLLISPSAISKQIERLRKKGYVERITDEEDRRSVWVKLSATGDELITTIAFNEELDHTKIVEKLSNDERLVLNHLLKKLLLQLEKQLEV